LNRTIFIAIAYILTHIQIESLDILIA